MEVAADDKECSHLWNLFQQIIADMKNGLPMWDDFVSKATKLHSALKSTLVAVSVYLDAFQKIADAATNARGATKEIGTALTRMCLRHKAIENKVKLFTSLLLDSLIAPLTASIDEWRKNHASNTGALSRDHARDVKRLRSEVKRRTHEVHRAKKKAKSHSVGGSNADAHKRIEIFAQDLTERRQQLEDLEERAVKAALIEERFRFCHFVSLLKPVVESEVEVLAEVGHLQEGAGQLFKQILEPRSLPSGSQQVISDLKSSCNISTAWDCLSQVSQLSPASHSPTPSSRLGSRKSSLCSISSLSSASSGSQNQPFTTASSGGANASNQSSSSSGTPAAGLGNVGVATAHRSISQNGGRLCSVWSRDSGFTSQDTLHLPPLPQGFIRKGSDNNSFGSACTTPAGSIILSNDGACEVKTATSSPDGLGNAGSATWPELKERAQFERAAAAILANRPHTISTAYEKGHNRPALTVHTFSNASQPDSPSGCVSQMESQSPHGLHSPHSRDQSGIYARPPLPMRCSSLERPTVPAKCQSGNLHPDFKTGKPSSLPPHLTKEMPQATYVNMCELATMAANMAANRAQTQTQQTEGQAQDKICSESSASESSLESSSGYGSQGGAFSTADDAGHHPHIVHRPQPPYSDESEITPIEVSRRPRDSISSSVIRDSLSLSLGSLEEAVRSLEEVDDTPVTAFATIKCKPSVPKKRPLSMTVGTIRGPNRRGSTVSLGGPGSLGSANNGSPGSKPPPPPVRRTSSISRPPGQQSQYQQPQQLMTMSTGSGTCDADTLPPPPAFLLNPESDSRCSTPVLQGHHGINVAETVKALTELKHTPASPGLLRRSLQHQHNQSQTGSQQNLHQAQQNANQPLLSTFQQSKTTFTNLQSQNNVNPIYGTTGHRIMTYVDQNPKSMNMSSQDLYRDYMNTSASLYDNSMGRNNSSSSTLSYSFSPNSSNDSSTTSFRTDGSIQRNTSHSEKRKNPTHANTIYAQPSQIIAGFNSIALSKNADSLSPLALRKNIAVRSQSADRRGSDGNSSTTGSLIAALSAKLVPQLSPRNSRRNLSISSAMEQHTTSSLRNSQESLECMQSKNKALSGAIQPDFLNKLSATIQHQNRLLQQDPQSANRAHHIRQTINAQTQPDPRVCHGSLMEQIKRGATLRRNKHCNDRSAPKIR